jgi:hypothetical protein
MELARLIEERREELILELCGTEYSRSHSYKRGGFVQKDPSHWLGDHKVQAETVIRRKDDKTALPILDALDVNRRKYARDVQMKLSVR